MKHILLLVLFAASSALVAQNKVIGFSTCGRFGDSNSGGSIFESNVDGTEFRTLKDFVFDRVGLLDGDLVKGPDGFLYGLSSGIDGELQTVYYFKINPAAGQLTVLHRFEGFYNALSAPVWGQDGYFYFCCGVANSTSKKLLRVSLDGQEGAALANIPSSADGYTNAECYNLHLVSTGSFNFILPGNRLARYVANASSIQIVKQFNQAQDGRLDIITDGFNGVLYGVFSPPPTANWTKKLFRIKPDGSVLIQIDLEPADFDLGYVKDLLIWNDSLIYATTLLNYPNTGLLEINLAAKTVTQLYDLLGNDIDYIGGKLEKTSAGNIVFAGKANLWEFRTNDLSLHKIKQLNTTQTGFAGGRVSELPNGKYYFMNLDLTAPKVFSVKSDGAGLENVFIFNQPSPSGATPLKLIKTTDGAYVGILEEGGEFGKGYMFTMHAMGDDYSAIIHFDDLHLDFKNAVFYEGKDGRIYFGAYKNYLDTWGNSTPEYGLYSVQRDGSNLELLVVSKGAATSAMEASDGKIYWIDNFWVSRMNTNGAALETNWVKIYSPDDEFMYTGRLTALPNGDLFGGIDYYYDDCTGSVGYDEWLSFFLHPDGTVEVKQNLKSEGLLALDFDKVQNFDVIIEPGGFTSAPTGYTLCSPSLSGNSQLIAQKLTDDNLLWGTRTYADRRFDIQAVNTQAGSCAYNIPWRQEMGYQGRLAFVTEHSTSTNEAPRIIDISTTPNPSHSNFQVKIPDLAVNLSWKLFDSSGQMVLSGFSDDPVFDIAVENLPPGVYHFHAVNSKGSAQYAAKISKF